MREHINAVVTHFRGKVFSWDVVNEAIADDQGYLRESNWLNSLGEEFIEEAFRAAHAADPKAEPTTTTTTLNCPKSVRRP